MMTKRAIVDKNNERVVVFQSLPHMACICIHIPHCSAFFKCLRRKPYLIRSYVETEKGILMQTQK